MFAFVPLPKNIIRFVRSRSASVGSARVKKMKARDELLEVHDILVSCIDIYCLVSKVLKKETTEKLAAFCKSQEYPAFVKKLIIQGLIKIEEQEVEIQCKAEDKAIVSKVVR